MHPNVNVHDKIRCCIEKKTLDLKISNICSHMLDVCNKQKNWNYSRHLE